MAGPLLDVGSILIAAGAGIDFEALSASRTYDGYGPVARTDDVPQLISIAKAGPLLDVVAILIAAGDAGINIQALAAASAA